MAKLTDLAARKDSAVVAAQAQEYLDKAKAVGAAGYHIQRDVLQVAGAILTAQALVLAKLERLEERKGTL